MKLDEYLDMLLEKEEIKNLEWSKRTTIKMFTDKLRQTRKITWLYYIMRALHVWNLTHLLPTEKDVRLWLLFELKVS